MKIFRQNPALAAALIGVAAVLCACKSGNTGEISIIPAPSHLEVKADAPFRISSSTKLVARTFDEQATAGFFADKIAVSTGKILVISDEPAVSDAIIFEIDPASGIPAEGYTLESGENAVFVTASDSDGLFYGMQTILQLLPPQVQSDKVLGGIDLSIPAVSIQDAPRFHYRGMHIDPCRHFRDAEWVKKQLDVMAMFKYNKLHFHLTEDQGWRIEIKKYPKLTSFGPYYTQDEIRDIVAYAAERHIDVIPELEIPGHEMAAIAAYPWLSCNEGQYEPRKIWGVENIVMCPGKETTFEFLEDVIDEMVDLFPCELFHIGGDECPREMWEKCPLCQKRIRDEHLYGDESQFTNEDRLQSYVVRRIEKYLNGKGKRIIGWDEILEGDIDPSAIIMSWRGLQGGITGAEHGHQVIMTPSSDGMYLDYYQGDRKIEPVGIGSYFTMEMVYAYNPIPAEVDSLGLQDYILGVQCNNWSEYFYTDSVTEYRTWPRAVAVSEIAWSQPENKDWDDFLRRLDGAHLRMDMHHIHYHIPLPEQPGGSCNTVAFTDSTTVTFKTTRPVRMVYTLNGKEPTARSREYTAPLHFTDNATLKIRSVLPTGEMSTVRTIDIVKMDPLPAVKPTKPLLQGLEMTTTPGEFFNTRELFAADRVWTAKNITKLREISAQSATDAHMRNVEQYAAVAEGYVRIDSTDVYYISSNNDEVWIDGRLVIDNNNEVKRYSRRDNCLVLEGGLHQVKIVFLGHIIGGVPSNWDSAAIALRAKDESGFHNIPDTAYFRAE
ncbi:MAG: family 20 glycosylhydrolase [Bacteroidales bacterium]|nr:family 20 glycosylhydrolase [Bacteroidales bacterium]